MVQGGVFKRRSSCSTDFISSLLLFSCSSIKFAPLFGDLTALNISELCFNNSAHFSSKVTKKIRLKCQPTNILGTQNSFI